MGQLRSDRNGYCCRDCLYSLIAIVLAHLGLVWCATHWVSSQDGRIYATQDSYFNLAQPHDLIELLRQEQRVREAHDPTVPEQSADHNSKKSADSDGGGGSDSGEESTSEDGEDECAGFESLSMNYLLTSSAITLDKLGFDMDTFIGPPSEPTSKKLLQPHCQKFLKLPFSMAAFEHLPSLINREQLWMAAEEEIAPLLHPGWENTSHFGHAVTLALKENANSWVLYNLATFYWRVIGKAAEAVECTRRALHLTPRRYLAVPMLNLANMLVAADQDEDAIVVLDALVTLNDTIAAVYCKAAEAYAATHNYNASLFAFEACLLLDGDFPGAKKHKRAVSCFLRQQERTLKHSFESDLHRSINDLAAYQSKLLDYQNLHQRILNAQADLDTRKQAALAYDWFTFGKLESLRCRYVADKINDKEKLQCHVDEWDVYRLIREHLHEQLYSKTYKDYARRPGDGKQKQPSTEPPVDASTLGDSESYKQAVILRSKSMGWATADTTDITPLYPMTDRDHLYPADYVFEDSDWPSKQLCQKSFLPSRQQMPRLFQSPSDRGFNVSMILTDRLQLSGDEQHPLPWYPPMCSATEALDMDCCDHLLGVQRVKKLAQSQSYAEVSLAQTLLNLTGVPADSMAEVGQRIYTAMAAEVGPSWLLYNLAALYWRVHGQPAEAAACLRAVLSSKQQAMYHDIALVQLAQMVELAGDRIDDAVILLKQAIDINDQQPWAHYLLSHYLIHNHNMTGAGHHLLQVLNIDPLFPGALQVYKAVKCQLKALAGDLNGGMPSFGHSTLGGWPKKFFCLGRGAGGEYGLEQKCFFEESSTCPMEQIDTTNKEPICVPPPAHALFIVPMIGAPSKSGKSKEDFTARYLGTTVSDIPSEQAANTEDDQNESEEELSVDNMPDEEPGVEMTLDHDNSLVWEPSVHRQPVHQPNSQTIVQYANNLDLPSRAPKDHNSPHMQATRSMLQQDTPLPEVLPRPSINKVLDGANYVYDLPSSSEQCAQLNARVDLEAATSTWLSVTAKGIKLEQLIDFVTPVDENSDTMEPICPHVESTIWTMDHLAGYHHRDSLTLYKPERGLKDAFEKLGNRNESMQIVATRLAQAMRESQQHASMHDSQDGGVHWALSTVAALYWRVKGDAPNAIRCLRHSLKNSPENMRDLALVSLANVYHQAGMLHSALIAGAAALNLSPDFVVIHFTLANIYSAMGSLDLAMQFYFSTLSRQHNFEPARERIRAIYCITNRLPVTEMPMVSGPTRVDV